MLRRPDPITKVPVNGKTVLLVSSTQPSICNVAPRLVVSVASNT